MSPSLCRAWLVAPVFLAVAPVLETPPSPTSLCRTLPAELPNLATWLHSTGDAELANPKREISYALYFESRRSAVYGVTHYRARYPDAQTGEALDQEVVQWIVGTYRPDNPPRRFQVTSRAADGTCAWRELKQGTQAYDSQLGLLLSVYGLHQRMLWQRDADATTRN